MSAGTVGRYAEIGSRIKRSRRRQGISQERFAPLVGITRRHLIRLENGEHLPSPELRVRLAEHTGESPEFFSLDDDEEAEPVADLMRALNRWHDAKTKETA